MKYRFAYGKVGLVRFISHLDLMRVLFRSFSRAGLPVAYSQGFTPHPRFEFCPPLRVGMEGLRELCDAELTGEIDIPAAIATLNKVLPSGIGIGEARALPPSSPTLGAAISGARYSVQLFPEWPLAEPKLKAFLSLSEAKVSRMREGRQKVSDARRGVRALSLSPGEGGRRELYLETALPGASPTDVLQALLEKPAEELRGALWRRLGFVGEGLERPKGIASAGDRE
jgi:radical SAM-linked protein